MWTNVNRLTNSEKEFRYNLFLKRFKYSKKYTSRLVVTSCIRSCFWDRSVPQKNLALWLYSLLEDAFREIDLKSRWKTVRRALKVHYQRHKRSFHAISWKHSETCQEFQSAFQRSNLETMVSFEIEVCLDSDWQLLMLQNGITAHEIFKSTWR